MKKTSFVKGTLLLAVINFIIRALGFVYRILLSRLIGPQAIGLYQMVFPFLMVLITITTAGIPVAVSKLVAQENSLGNRRGVYGVLTMAILTGGGIAAALTVVVSLNMNWVIQHILKNEQLYYPFLWSIPAIGIITLSSIIRGFFYGLKAIKPVASAQIVEQCSRIIFVVSILYFLRPKHPVTAATIAIMGLTVGELLGLLVLLFQFNFNKLPQYWKTPQKYKHAHIKGIKGILYIAVPLTISRLLSTLLQTMNSILIPQRLAMAGYSAEDAIAIYGKISGMASPLLYLPFTITNALVVNIIPNLSEELAVNNMKEVIYKSNLAIKITLLTAIPVTGLFIALGKDLATFIYHDPEVGNFLSLLSYATLFLCLQSTLSGILQGIGKQVSTTLNFLLGMVVQLYCTYTLMPNPQYGIYGYFIGFILSALLIFILHFIVLVRHVPISIPLGQWLIKPTLCTGAMVGVMYLLRNWIPPGHPILQLGVFALGLGVYCIGLFISGVLRPKTLLHGFNR